MRRTYNIYSRIFLLLATIWISFSCAQQGAGALVGGDKDISPPTILKSTPENFSTNFAGRDFEFVFDEYFALKDLNKKLIISPPMEEKPEIKIKGKKLLIHFISELLPDRTYTLNFADALVDLNESNAYENFSVVFSTGNEIDSLEMQGTVVDAFTGKPVEGVSVMLYNTQPETRNPKPETRNPQPETRNPKPATRNPKPETRNPKPETRNPQPDSLPLYVSRTNKEGKYHLKNLADGQYKIFALLDGNNNYLFDQPTEQIAFTDSLQTGSVPLKTQKDTTSTPQPETRTAQPETRNPKPETRTAQPETRTPQPAPRLRLFLESPPKQQVRGTERKQADKVLIIFNEGLDSVNMELLYADEVEGGLLFEWSEERDSLTCWVTDSLLSARDSLVFATGYLGYDSLEQREWMVDTLRFKYRSAPPGPEDKTPMSLLLNTGRSMDPGRSLRISTGIPYETVDTSRISLFRTRDSLEFREEYRIKQVEQEGSVPGINQDLTSTRVAIIEKVFLQDSAYSLRILPGAFTGYLGHTNDSLDLNFTVNNIDKYGSLVMQVDSLDRPAILQLLNSKEETIMERMISGDTKEKFALLNPGKYKFRLIMDDNQNGKWDTGRYIKHIQPEEVLIYDKEITLKANWEMEEVWVIK